MIIIPTIELQDGKCVSLRRGNMDDRVVHNVDPVSAAKKFEAAGAERLHITDLDGVLQGGRHNGDTAKAIFDAVSIPCQVGGGIRTMAAAEWWMNHGADRIVLGTAAVKDRTFVRDACARFPGKVVVSVDARGGKVVIEGWRETTTFGAIELAKDLEYAGVAAIIFTDIDMDDRLPDASFSQTAELAKQLTIPVISSGTARSLDNISTLKYLPNIHGVIVGRSLFLNEIALPDAIAVAKTPVPDTPFI